MDDRLSRNLRCIEEGFVANGLHPERRYPTGMQLYVNTRRAVLSISAFSSDDGSWIVLYGSHPTRVPVGRHPAVLEAMARINYQQIVGSFDLDVTDGEMRYRIGHGTDVEPLTADVVERLLGYLLYTWDRFNDALMSVAYGNRAPADAVREALEQDEAPDESPATQSGDEGGAPPVDIDAILADLGLTGPIGSTLAEVQHPTDDARESIDVTRPMASTPFSNAYVVPGSRLIAGEYPGAKDLGEARRKVRALLDAGVTRVIDLTRSGELTSYARLLVEEGAARGIAVRHARRPIRDVDVCTPEQMRVLLDEIDDALAAGETVYVHCWGGVGRTGTVVGCWLVRHGRSGSEALAEVQRLFETMSPAKVARHPEGSPQTATQRAMVHGWGAMDARANGAGTRRER